MTPVHTYSEHVDKLLTFGDAHGNEWPDYLALGLNQEDIPALIRLVTDEDLFWSDLDDVGEDAWMGIIHAWRTLGQLHAEAAVEPLISLFHKYDEADWVTEDLPQAIAMIGPAAIPALKKYLADDTHDFFMRHRAAIVLTQMPEYYPEVKAACIAAIRDQLANFANQDPALNGFLIDDLIDFKAVETAPLIKQAFYGKHVDRTIVGNWSDVKKYLGLEPSDVVPGEEPEEGPIPSILETIGSAYLPPKPKKTSQDRKAKAKRKQEKKSRKKNRKR